MRVYITPVEPNDSGFGMYHAENFNTEPASDYDYQPFESIASYRDFLTCEADYDVTVANDLDGRIEGQNGRTCYRITNEDGESLELWEEAE